MFELVRYSTINIWQPLKPDGTFSKYEYNVKIQLGRDRVGPIQRAASKRRQQ